MAHLLLVHKFGSAQEGDVDAYLQDILSNRRRISSPRAGSLSLWTNAIVPNQANPQAMKAAAQRRSHRFYRLPPQDR